METWKFIKGLDGYAGSSFTEVSDQGRIRQHGQVVSPTIDCEGYAYVYLCKGGHKAFISRLVLETFIGPPSAGQVCVRENPGLTDNTLENLRWGTPSEVWAWRKARSPKKKTKVKKVRAKRSTPKTRVFDEWFAEYKRLEQS